jgi:hypothetical protein
MEIKINRVTYPLHFGIAFLREIDKRYDKEVKEQGNIRFGVGLLYFLPLISMGNPVALTDCIQAGTITQNQKPSLYDIENFLFADETDLGELGQVFMKAFDESKAIIKTLENINKTGQRLSGETQESEEETEQAAEDKPKITPVPTNKKTAKAPTED